MSILHSLERSVGQHDTTHDAPHAVGKTTTTARHVMRKRDGNGVAPTAEQAVDQASGSTGTELPGELRERFESSLGTELSTVRVHDGSASAEAASAVGARAYTIGQDIHFGDGQYDPSSQDGVFLIAHEVAHTVQQRGVAPVRQNKLEVSSPGDGAEVEADRAAHAMVTGAPASVGFAGGIARQVLYRDADPAAASETAEHPASVPSDECRPSDVSPALNGPNQWKPDPSDPFHKPPTDYSALPGNEKDGPPPAPLGAPPPFVAAESKPYVNQRGQPWDCGSPGDRLPVQEERARACQEAFSTAWSELSNTTTVAYPPITAYFDTAKELKGDLHAKLGWSDAGGGKAMSDVAAAQPGADVFKGPDGKMGKDAQVDTKHDPAKQPALDEARRRVNIARSQAETAAAEYKSQVDRAANAASGVGIALKEIKLKSKKDESAKLEQEKKKLETQQAARAKDIDMVVKGLQGATKLAFGIARSDPKALKDVADVGIWLAGEAVKAFVSASTDQKIEELKGAVEAAKVEIDESEVELLGDKLAAAKATFATEHGAIAAKRTAAADALGAEQTAYTDFAKLAGEASTGDADGKKKVQDAIAFVPKVEHLLGTLAPIRGALNLPGYTANAGVGLNVLAAQAGPFVEHYCLVKGYKTRFQKEHEEWSARLKSLQAVVDGFAK